MLVLIRMLPDVPQELTPLLKLAHVPALPQNLSPLMSWPMLQICPIHVLPPLMLLAHSRMNDSCLIYPRTCPP